MSLLSRAESCIQKGWFSCEGCFLSLMSRVGGFSGGNSEHLQHSFRFESLSKKSIFFRILLQSYFSVLKRTWSWETSSNPEMSFAVCCFVLPLCPIPNITLGCSWSPTESLKCNVPPEGTSRNYVASFSWLLPFFCGTTEYPKAFWIAVLLLVSIFSEGSSTSIPGTCSHP